MLVLGSCKGMKGSGDHIQYGSVTHQFIEHNNQQQEVMPMQK
jgi:hypothetical protein